MKSLLSKDNLFIAGIALIIMVFGVYKYTTKIQNDTPAIKTVETKIENPTVAELPQKIDPVLKKKFLVEQSVFGPQKPSRQPVKK